MAAVAAVASLAEMVAITQTVAEVVAPHSGQIALPKRLPLMV
jgi:hypothetical protein